MKNWIRAVFALTLFVAAGALQACNTVEGAGEDMQAAGRGIERSAERNR